MASTSGAGVTCASTHVRWRPAPRRPPPACCAPARSTARSFSTRTPPCRSSPRGAVTIFRRRSRRAACPQSSTAPRRRRSGHRRRAGRTTLKFSRRCCPTARCARSTSPRATTPSSCSRNPFPRRRRRPWTRRRRRDVEPAGEIEATVPASALGRGDARLSFARWLGWRHRRSRPASAAAAAARRRSRRRRRRAGRRAALPAVATAGALSNLHYDEYHNFYVQLHGEDLLARAADSVGTVRSFKNNDRFRQSPSRALRFGARRIALRRASDKRVDAGKLLYIPPYHWHQTLTRARRHHAP